jgi:hypothetical protein
MQKRISRVRATYRSRPVSEGDLRDGVSAKAAGGNRHTHWTKLSWAEGEGGADKAMQTNKD